MIGVGMVQTSSIQAAATVEDGQNELLGFMAVLAACCSSGLAGVYFEWVLKGSKVSRLVPVWCPSGVRLARGVRRGGCWPTTTIRQ